MLTQNLYNIIKLTGNDIVSNVHVETVTQGKKKKEIKSFRVAHISIDEARQNNSLISFADNFMFREIRKYNNDHSTQLEVADHVELLREEIKKIKKLENTQENRNALLAKINELDEYLFVPEVISVTSYKKDYSRFAKKGFYYDGKLYTRYCASSGNLKSNTALFMLDDVNKAVSDVFACGHKDISKSEEVIPEKYGAYKGLTTSGINFITLPKVVVIPDFEEITPKGKVNFVEKNIIDGQVEYKVVPKDFDSILNSFDGMGLISSAKVGQYCTELGLDYEPAALNIRAIGVKGLLINFDFHELAKENNIIWIKNLKGDLVNINNYDVLLTASQWKLHGLYDDDWGAFDRVQQDNDLVWGVQRVTPKQDDDTVKLNYQLVQSSNLKDDDIEELLKPTKELFTKLAEGDDFTTIKYLMEENLLNDETDHFRGTILNQALLRNRSLLQDTYVKEEIHKLVASNLKLAKIAKILCRGMYSYMVSDPYALAQWAIFRDKDKVTGLIPANCIFSKYWNDRNADEVDACRSPMTDIAEHNILTVCNDTSVGSDTFAKMKHYYSHIYSGIIYSIWDLSTIIHSDSDWDSDQCLTTDSAVLKRCAYRDALPVTYQKGLTKAQKKKYTIKAAVESDLKGFGNKVGFYSNKTTSFFAMLPLFNKDEQKGILDNIRILRLIIGEEIDSTKTGVKPKLPVEFIYQKLKSDDTKEVRKKKMEHNTFVPKYKPYFFRYRDTTDNDRFTKYQSHMKPICQRLLYITLDKLLALKDDELTDKQKNFKQIYIDCSPLLLTNCVMNKLCWNLEEFEKTIADKLKVDTEKNYVLLGFAKEVDVSVEDKAQVIEVFNRYNKKAAEIIKEIHSKRSTDDEKKEIIMEEKEKMQDETKKELYKICSNKFMLFDRVVTSLKDMDKDKVNQFIWKVFEYDLLSIIPKDNIILKAERKNNGDYDIFEVTRNDYMAG
ncbi:hypothetical protein [Caproiciproducens sp. CPB-2]|uniref:hypothetical protein n=1 Tax=Caproiciproducens sp. CPB-2 TaxID=3030017 RepID=UPI0023DA5AEF|nr:hypothetical protein [Caproiciproducens sp. CPB-2]MDF1496320.1 hypothetical protein [Caproiciproducens sp. CPB-2]